MVLIYIVKMTFVRNDGKIYMVWREAIKNATKEINL